MASLWSDRWRRRQEKYQAAVSRFRSTLIASGNWTSLPYPLSHAGRWQIRLLDQTIDLSAMLPRKVREDISTWLVTGVTGMGNAQQFEERITTQAKLVEVAARLSTG